MTGQEVLDGVFVCKVLAGKRIAIPEEICEDLNLKVGDYIRLSVDKDGILIEPVVLLPRVSA